MDMNAEKLSQRWYKVAITYFVIGIGFGVYMGASGDHSLFPVHAHINLLGWASMGLTGLLYKSFPAAAETRLATWHFWLYQLAVPVMLFAVALIYSGMPQAEPVAGAASRSIMTANERLHQPGFFAADESAGESHISARAGILDCRRVAGCLHALARGRHVRHAPQGLRLGRAPGCSGDPLHPGRTRVGWRPEGRTCPTSP